MVWFHLHICGTLQGCHDDVMSDWLTVGRTECCWLTEAGDGVHWDSQATEWHRNLTASRQANWQGIANWVFFSVRTTTHEPLHLARWNFARTCTLTTAKNPENFNVLDQRSRSQGQIFRFFYCCKMCKKKLVDTITHELLQLAWWNFARTFNSTTSRTLLNFKVRGQGHMVFCAFLHAWCCGYPWAVLSLEQGLILCRSVIWCRRSLSVRRCWSLRCLRLSGTS